MANDTIYLVYILIEINENTSVKHTTYRNLEDAQKQMADEIKDCRQNFHSGKAITDMERLYEFRDNDGYGFTVGIDELKIL